MKLIYIANSRIPTEKAHGIQIMKMCEAFSDAGVNVELVLPMRLNYIKESPFIFYGTKHNFKIHRLPCIDLVGCGKLGFYIQSFSFAIASFFYILKKNADFIYSRDELPLYFLSFFKKNIFWEIHTPKWNFVSRRVLKVSKGIISITHGLKNFYMQNGVKAEIIFVAPDGVDLKQFDINMGKDKIRENLELAKNKKIVMYAGHLYDWKGVQVLADASLGLPSDVAVVFLGGTDIDIASFREKNKDKKNIFILGRKSHSDVSYYLKSANVLVLPNSAKSEISEKYTSPMKLFEYMASGIPIVASDLPSIREVLSNNNAILVRPDDPKDLADGICIGLKDSILSGNIGSKSLADAVKYTWESRASNILDFIKYNGKSS